MPLMVRPPSIKPLNMLNGWIFREGASQSFTLASIKRFHVY